MRTQDNKPISERPVQAWHLQLADGRQWALRSDKGLMTWMKRFAGILGLQPANITPRSPTLLIRNEPPPDARPADYELRTVSLRRSGESSDWSCTLEGRRGKRGDIELMRQSLMAVYLDTIGRGGFPCHGGLLNWQGRGILVAGGTRTGKSTTCRRLVSTGTVLCDEETLIVRDAQGRYWGHPFPTWSCLHENAQPRSWAVQSAVPVEGIFFIFPAKRDRYIPVGLGEAAARLTRVALDKSLIGWRYPQGKVIVHLKRQIFDNACALVFKVPAARLNVSLECDIEREMTAACQNLWKENRPEGQR
ncbi:MAG: SynChlorMet cassette protein ScmC [Syntrophales bacterium]|nr:SynChlorMet cassette protein ScmC [Syntrophales bacterium]